MSITYIKTSSLNGVKIEETQINKPRDLPGTKTDRRRRKNGACSTKKLFFKGQICGVVIK